MNKYTKETIMGLRKSISAEKLNAEKRGNKPNEECLIIESIIDDLEVTKYKLEKAEGVVRDWVEIAGFFRTNQMCSTCPLKSDCSEDDGCATTVLKWVRSTIK